MSTTPKDRYRILYFGTPQFSSDILYGLSLDDRLEIIGVVTGKRKLRGRHSSVPTPVAITAEKLGIPVFECDQPKSIELKEFVDSFPADFGIIVAWRILPETIYSAPRFGTMNLHGSLLPKYRGAAPVQRAIWNGETKTGLTVFLLNQGVDTGNVLLQEKMAISDHETSGDLFEKMTPIGIELLKTAIIGFATNQLTPQLQPNEQTTPAPKIKPSERWIHWNESSIMIRNQIHALSPSPCAITLVDGVRVLFYRVSAIEVDTIRDDNDVGTISLTPHTLMIRTVDGWLRIHSLAIEGKRVMSDQEFLNGYRSWHSKRCYSLV